MSSSIQRTIAVSLAIGLLGAVMAAMSAGLAVIIVVSALDGPRYLFDAEVVSVILQAVAFGAAFGFVALPTVGWGLLRRVPLGRAALFSTLGAVVGGFMGEWLFPFNPYRSALPGLIGGIVVGFIAAAIALRIFHQTRRSPAVAPPPNEELKPTASTSSLVE